MKQFIKFTLASMLGTFLTLILFSIIMFFFTILFITGLTAVSSEEIDSVSPNTILELRLDYTVPERTTYDPLLRNLFPIVRLAKPMGLNDIIANIRKAKADKNIRGIYLNLNKMASSSFATLEAIRKELLDFKSSGKLITAHGDYIFQRGYYLASVADQIYLTPSGYLDFKGLSAEMMFFKKTLEKLEIEPQTFHYGQYKGAIEPYNYEKMTEANREQINSLLSSIYDHMLKNIEESTGLEYDDLRSTADNFLIQNAEDAYKYKLVDSLVYKDQAMSIVKNKFGFDEDYKLRVISMRKYSKVRGFSKPYSSNRIAVIYAVGEIDFSKGDEETIGTDNIIRAIRRARDNDKVKAIVMRVNSPGGVMLTADMIWREVERARKEKPFIVSMGGVAASGGFYISCTADTIVAEPNTITGSIGVYTLFPNTEKFFENILGITFDRVKTGKYSDFGSITRPLIPEEKKIIQKRIDEVYNQFVMKVSEGRNMTFEEVDNIAQGRVWTGLQAMENGLVDVIGGLDDAIEIAADKANIDNYKVVNYPVLKEPFEFIQELFFGKLENLYLQYKLGDKYKYYEHLNELPKLIGINYRMPFDVEIY